MAQILQTLAEAPAKFGSPTGERFVKADKCVSSCHDVTTFQRSSPVAVRIRAFPGLDGGHPDLDSRLRVTKSAFVPSNRGANPGKEPAMGVRLGCPIIADKKNVQT